MIPNPNTGITGQNEEHSGIKRAKGQFRPAGLALRIPPYAEGTVDL